MPHLRSPSLLCLVILLSPASHTGGICCPTRTEVLLVPAQAAEEQSSLGKAESGGHGKRRVPSDGAISDLATAALHDAWDAFE